jgi:phage shock protein A
MPDKLFAFNAGSFSLGIRVEDFLKSKGAIALDFGSSAYINSEAMAVILSELVEKSEATSSSAASAETTMATLRAELGRFSAERQRLMEDNARLASQVQSLGSEVASLKEHIAGSARTIEALKAENSRMAAASKTPTQAQAPQPADDRMRLSYEKLAKEFQELRRQSAEAITSLKVLEEENEELREEVESLRAQARNAPAAKAG